MQNGSKDTVISFFGVSQRDTPFYTFWSIFIYLVITGSVILFILWPIVSVLLTSIYQEGVLNFSNYRELFTQNRQLLKNSIFVAVLSTSLAVFLGLNIALFITHSNNRGKKIVLAVLLLTMISPPFVSSLAYIMLFGKRGIITYKLLGLSLNPYGWHGIVLMQSIGFTSLAALLIIGVLKGINKSLEQASLDLGAGSYHTLIKIVIPVAKPGIIAAALITFIRSLSDFGTPIIIGGGYSVLATEAYLNVIGLYDLPKASAMSTLLLLPALVVFIIYRKVIGKSQFFSRKTGSTGYSEMKLSGWINFILAAITWFFIVLVMLKYLTIFMGAFVKTWGVDYSFSLKHINALTTGKLGSFIRSLQYSLIAGISGSVIGLLLAYILERKRLPGYQALDFVATLPFMIPGTFFGIGYILAFHNYPLAFTGTAFIVVVNCIYRQLPLGTKAGTTVLSQLNPEIEYSAADLGARDMHVFKDIILPALKPAFILSFINTFTTTMTTIGAIIFLVTPGSKVATVEMFDAIKRGDLGLGAVIANLIIISVLIINISSSWFFLRRKTKDFSRDRGTGYVSSVETINQKI